MAIYIDIKKYIEEVLQKTEGGAGGLAKYPLASDLPEDAEAGDVAVVIESNIIYIFDEKEGWVKSGVSGDGSTGGLTKNEADSYYATKNHTHDNYASKDHSHDEINTIQNQVNALGNGMVFKAEVATYADIPEEKVQGDTFVVSSDENKGGDRSLYTYNGQDLVYLGTFGVSAGAVIDDMKPAINTVYSSQKVEDLIDNLPTGGGEGGNSFHPSDVIDDEIISDVKSYSSQKIEERLREEKVDVSNYEKKWYDYNNANTIPSVDDFDFNEKVIHKDMIYMVKKEEINALPSFETEQDIIESGYTVNEYNRMSYDYAWGAFVDGTSYARIKASPSDPGYIEIIFDQEKKFNSIDFLFGGSTQYPAEFSIEISDDGEEYVEIERLFDNEDTLPVVNGLRPKTVDFNKDIKALSVRFKFFTYGPNSSQGNVSIYKIEFKKHTKHWQVVSERFIHSDTFPNPEDLFLNTKLIKDDTLYYLTHAEGNVIFPSDALNITSDQSLKTNGFEILEETKAGNRSVGILFSPLSNSPSYETKQSSIDDPSSFTLKFPDVVVTNKIKLTLKDKLYNPKTFNIYLSEDGENFNLVYQTFDYENGEDGTHHLELDKFYNAKAMKVELFESFRNVELHTIKLWGLRLIEAGKDWKPVKTLTDNQENNSEGNTDKLHLELILEEDAEWEFNHRKNIEFVEANNLEHWRSGSYFVAPESGVYLINLNINFKNTPYESDYTLYIMYGDELSKEVRKDQFLPSPPMTGLSNYGDALFTTLYLKEGEAVSFSFGVINLDEDVMYTCSFDKERTRATITKL